MLRCRTLGWLTQAGGFARRSLDDLDEGEGAGEPCLLVQPWWANHLQESGAGDPDGAPLLCHCPHPTPATPLQWHCYLYEAFHLGCGAEGMCNRSGDSPS